MSETNNVPVAEAVEKKCVNCPKCGTALYVKEGNYAHICPVCSQMFRIRTGTKLVKDVSQKTMVEAYVTVDKNAEGEVTTESVVADPKN